ncbi:MAG: SRPBCC family protein [Nitrospiraceae bacterium]
MAIIEKSIEVNVPRSAAYNQWTSFDEYPRFMEGVKDVDRAVDGSCYHWKAKIAGQDLQWDAVITERTEHQRLGMAYRSGAIKGWVATFDEVSKDWSRVTLQVEYDPQGFAENMGDAPEVVSSRVQGDLERFKSFIENRGSKSPFADWQMM